MSDRAIIVNEISKAYRLGVINRNTLHDEVRYWWHKMRGRDPRHYMSKVDAVGKEKSQTDESGSRFWALRDISFEVPEGEVIGIIGKNGAGKSTLLKILTHVTEPTSGQAILNGRVASLLEVGTGFHPELTGRENIYLNGSILGMKKTEISRKFDEIVEFAEMGQFIDTPVKRYSSGMYVRLAFAVAAHLEPEILLVDEVLAVGDAEFQKKCLGKMKEVSGQGRTILFVSHNMTAISNLCQRVLLIDRGRLEADGMADKIIAQYLNRNLTKGAVASVGEIEEKMEGVIKRNSPYVRYLEISLKDDNGQYRNSFNSTEDITVSIDFECLKAVKGLNIFVLVVNENSDLIMSTYNVDDKYITDNYNNLKPGAYTCSCKLPKNTFNSKTYYLTVHLVVLKTEHLFVEKILEFNVEFNGYNSDFRGSDSSYIRPKINWMMKPISGKNDG